MIILGVDPGTATTGYGIIEEKAGKIKLVDYGVIITEPKQPLEARLEIIYDQLGDIIDEYDPEEIAVEELFFSTNVKTAMAVGQARGVILLAAKKSGALISEYTPNQVKNGICGYGGADKKQVQKMVQMILKLDEIPQPDDAADALAIAICHSSSRKYINL
ncbi:MAG: crossover junction endodeoxyribonuclease RuvC [bacterium]